jgi:hypothetical protein
MEFVIQGLVGQGTGRRLLLGTVQFLIPSLHQFP